MAQPDGGLINGRNSFRLELQRRVANISTAKGDS
jgi:hypothetical protein